MRWHLPPAGAGVVGRAHRAQQHFIGSRTQAEQQRPVAIIRKEPVVAGLERKGRGHAHGFMTGARDLEENFLLALEQDLAVVHTARGKHDAISINELLAGEALVILAVFRTPVRSAWDRL